MSVAIDVSAVPADGFSFQPSALAELVAILHVLAEPDHHPNRASWAAAVTDGVDAHLLERIFDLDYLWRTSRADMFLPARPVGRLSDELDTLDALDDETWVSAALLTSSCGTIPLDRSLGSPLVDPRAAEVARVRAGLRGPRQLALADTMMADPDKARTRVRETLEAAERAFFGDMWTRLRPFLVDDARRKHDTNVREGIVRALEPLAPAVSVNSTQTRIVVDKLQDDFAVAGTEGVTFLPTVFGHPHVLVVHAPRWAPVIQYPTRDFPDLASAVPVEIVERRLRALDNPTRLRLLRSLIRGGKTTSELASIWGIGSPEISRHLAALKSAGLVVSHRDGRHVRHAVDDATIAALGQDLLDALLR